MSCRICGRDCPPGAKICRDCAAARKRAFAQTVTQPLLAAVGAPSIGEPRFAPKPLRPRAANDPTVERSAARAEPAPALPLTVVPRKFGVLWLFAAVLATTVVAVLLVRTMGTSAHSGDEGAPADALPPPAVAVPVPHLPPPAQELAPTRPESIAPPVKVAPLRPRRVVPRVEAPPAAVAPPPAPEPVPVARATTPPPRPVEAPRADPWQAMNEGLSRCAREALFDRIACEQRLRLQYCTSSWGLVPQCPIGPATDHGQ